MNLLSKDRNKLRQSLFRKLKSLKYDFDLTFLEKGISEKVKEMAEK